MNLSYFQEQGLKIAFMPSRNKIYQTQCFQRHSLTHASPMYISEVLQNCPTGLGLFLDLTRQVSDILKIPRDRQLLYLVTHGDYGTKKTDGTWGGVVADIINGTYDTALPTLTPTEERLSVIDFSNPTLRTQLAYMTK